MQLTSDTCHAGRNDILTMANPEDGRSPRLFRQSAPLVNMSAPYNVKLQTFGGLSFSISKYAHSCARASFTERYYTVHVCTTPLGNPNSCMPERLMENHEQPWTSRWQMPTRSEEAHLRNLCSTECAPSYEPDAYVL